MKNLFVKLKDKNRWLLEVRTKKEEKIVCKCLLMIRGKKRGK